MRGLTADLKGEIAMLEATMAKAVQPMVKIRKTSYPNVRIKIGRLVFDCFEEYNSAELQVESTVLRLPLVPCDRLSWSGQISFPHFGGFLDIIRRHPFDNLVVPGQKEINI